VKKQSSAWVVVWTAVGVASGFGHAAAQQTMVASRRAPLRVQAVSFNVPPQPLGDAIAQAAQQADVNVMWWAEVGEGLTAPRLEGTLTPQRAFAALLVNTPLRAVFVDEHNVVIRTAADAAPAAAARTPASDGTIQQGVDAQSKSPEASSTATPALPPQKRGDPPPTGLQGDEAKKGRLEEVVVSASKRSERLIDVPQSVSVLSSEDLTKLGATQFRDYANTIPGLSFQTEGPGLSDITLRGVTVGKDAGATVGLYVDDVPFGPSSGFGNNSQISLDPSLFDVDRVEVLRGPQGTLYGASTMGGLLKYVTKKPDLSSYGSEAEAGVSDTNNGGVGYNVAVAVNAPLVADKVGVRVSGFENHDGGYIDNVSLHQTDVNHADIYGGRIDILAKPTDPLSVRITGFLQDINRDGFPTADYLFNGQPLVGSLIQQRVFHEYFDQQFRLVSGTLSYDAGFVALSSITSYQTVRNQSLIDLSERDVPAFAKIEALSGVALPSYTNTNKFTQEVRATSESGRVIEWVIGGFYTHETSTVHQEFDLLNPGGLPIPNNLFYYTVPSAFEEYAAFGDLTWRITRKFDVTGGVRYAHDLQRFQQIGSGSLGLSAPAATSTGSTETYLANARYHFSDHDTTYFRYATGYRPGGPNFVALNTVTGQPLGPATFGADTLDSYEVGYKIETADSRFTLDLDAYYIRWNNIQVTVTVGGFGSRANAPGGATVRGGELSAAVHPVDAFTVAANVAYQDPKFSQAVPALGAAAGSPLADVPKFMGNLLADYVLPWEGWRPTIGGTLHYQDSANNGYGATAYRLPSYTTLDLRSGVTLKNVDVLLYLHNVTDSRGQQTPRVVGFTSLTLPFPISIIQPRTIGIEATTRF
jgi:iron complex outermembrane recepter protein